MCRCTKFGAKDAIQVQQQYCTQLKQYTQLEGMPNILHMHQKDQPLSTGSNPTCKMIMKLFPDANMDAVICIFEEIWQMSVISQKLDGHLSSKELLDWI